MGAQAAIPERAVVTILDTQKPGSHLPPGFCV
jgi:hypothetical protein